MHLSELLACLALISSLPQPSTFPLCMWIFDNFKDDGILSCSSEHLGLLRTKRDPDGPRRGTETLKTRLDMFRFEENVHSMLQEQTSITPTPSLKCFCQNR